MPTPPPSFEELRSRIVSLRRGSEPPDLPFPLEEYERGKQFWRRRAPRPRRRSRSGISYRSLRLHPPGDNLNDGRGARRKSRRKRSKSRKSKHHRARKSKHHRARKSKRKKSFRRRRSSKR